MNAILDELNKRQGGWSHTAGELKKRFERQRNVAFGLSLGGALLAWVASQFDGQTRLCIAMASAAMFGIVGVLKKRTQGDASAQPWVHARAISEALKRLAYTYAARGKGYNDLARRDDALRAAMAEVATDSKPWLAHYLLDHPGSAPRDDLAPDVYLRDRVDHQVDFYQGNADIYKAAGDRWRSREFWLAVATAVITFIAGVMNKKMPPAGSGADLVAFAAVLTTISGAIVAHIEAARFDFLVTTYRATALRLSDAKLALVQPADVASAEWAKFVGQCEQYIATENGSWVTKVGKT